MQQTHYSFYLISQPYRGTGTNKTLTIKYPAYNYVLLYFAAVAPAS